MAWHMYWPGTDPFYTYNSPDNNGRRTFYNVGYVPYFRTDGYLTSTDISLPGHYNYESGLDTPVSLSITGLFDSDTGHLDFTVTASTDEALPAGSYKLFIALTETDLYYAGSNGVLWHPNTMRDCFPSYDGVAVEFSGDFPQTASYSDSSDLDALFDWNNCRVVAWLQDAAGAKKVQQAAAVFVTELGDLTAVPASVPVAMALGQSYPNPFNPSTVIPVSVERSGAARLDILAADGRLVRTLHEGVLAAGQREFRWDGTDTAGHAVASGVYLARLSTGIAVQSKHLVLLK